MVTASALCDLGEDRSWASIWWAYGALHYDLSDNALARGLELLRRVEEPDVARAAALMLEAEISLMTAVHADREPDQVSQRAMLEHAVDRAPDWPGLRLRLARACNVLGDQAATRTHARRAADLFRNLAPTDDPFDSAITGRNMDRAYVAREIESLVGN